MTNENNTIPMSDQKLMDKADNLHCSDWGLCFSLAEKAVSAEAKEYIDTQAKRLYHLEERSCGCL